METFLEAIEHYGKGLGFIAPGHSCQCEECDLDDAESDSLGFSFRQCDSCGTRIGGDRFPAHAIEEATGEAHHLEVCDDCRLFHANGDAPTDWRP